MFHTQALSTGPTTFGSLSPFPSEGKYSGFDGLFYKKTRKANYSIPKTVNLIALYRLQNPLKVAYPMCATRPFHLSPCSDHPNNIW